MPNIHAAWFLSHGVGVFPIKDRGKEPLVRWLDYSCTRDQAERFLNYGVRLSDTLGVIDTDEPAAEAWVQAHVDAICPTSFRVTTGRGTHRYFRLLRPTPKFIHRDGLTIEFRNQGQYVLGPSSVHPSGAVYTPTDWSWVLTDIPIFPEFVFDDRPGASHGPTSNVAYEFPEEVSAGERHDALYKLLRQQKALGLDKESTWELVKLANEHRCRPPMTDMGELRRWFNRGYDAADRPIARVLPSMDALGLGGI